MGEDGEEGGGRRGRMGRREEGEEGGGRRIGEEEGGGRRGRRL